VALFCFQKNLCVDRKHSSMCSLAPHYCAKQAGTHSPLNTNRALFPMSLKRGRNVLQWNPFC